MSIDTSRIHAICFDIDGTLRNTDDQYVEKLQKWLHWVRFILPKGDCSLAARRFVMAMEEPGNFIIQIPDRLGIDEPIARVLDYFDRKQWIKSDSKETIIDGAIHCLTSLHTHYPLCIVSARGELQTMRFLEYFGLTPLFKCIATAQTTPHSKPYPDPLLWVSQQMSVPPEQCLMVGDTIVDILTAKAAGTQSVGVLSGFGETDELQAAGADLIMSSVDGLTQLLLTV